MILGLFLRNLNFEGMSYLLCVCVCVGGEGGGGGVQKSIIHEKTFAFPLQLLKVVFVYKHLPRYLLHDMSCSMLCFSFTVHTGAGLIVPEIQDDGKVHFVASTSWCFLTFLYFYMVVSPCSF